MRGGGCILATCFFLHFPSPISDPLSIYLAISCCSHCCSLFVCGHWRHPVSVRGAVAPSPPTPPPLPPFPCTPFPPPPPPLSVSHYLLLQPLLLTCFVAMVWLGRDLVCVRAWCAYACACTGTRSVVECAPLASPACWLVSPQVAPPSCGTRTPLACLAAGRCVALSSAHLDASSQTRCVACVVCVEV